MAICHVPTACTYSTTFGTPGSCQCRLIPAYGCRSAEPGACFVHQWQLRETRRTRALCILIPPWCPCKFLLQNFLYAEAPRAYGLGQPAVRGSRPAIGNRTLDALVLLAHFVGLLHQCREFWIYGNAGAHLIRAIDAALGPACAQWLTIPGGDSSSIAAASIQPTIHPCVLCRISTC